MSYLHTRAKWDYTQPLLENPQIAVPLEKLTGELYSRHRSGNYLLCQANDPRRGDGRSKEVRRIKTGSNYYADKEVLLLGFGGGGGGAFQS